MNVCWKIFYVDGSTFSNEDGNPEDASGFGVIAVVQEDEQVGVLVHQMKDFYCFDEAFGGWAAMDEFGLAQYIGKPGLKVIKLGEVMETAKYLEIIDSIRDDPDLPAKSARYEWERKLDG
jgi:hypothetical protein